MTAVLGTLEVSTVMVTGSPVVTLVATVHNCHLICADCTNLCHEIP